VHELSLCHSIVEIVNRARRGQSVELVHLQVGQRRQVVPGTLEYYWGLITEPGPLAGSELAIEHVPVEVMCHDCGATTLATDRLTPACGECGGCQVLVVTGDEFIVTMLDVRDESELLHG
jgi:hydrogenase nickel incorporation protein HypA/HybF